MAVTEHGFDTRATSGGGSYDGPIYWVVNAGGNTVTINLDENHFARKHLLLPSRNPDKLKALFDVYSLSDWINWAWYGEQPKFDEYVQKKARNRTAHRANVAPFVGGAVAPIGTPTHAGAVTAERQRWSEKYRGNPQPAAPANPIVGPLLPVGTGALQGGAQGNRNSVINLVTQSQKSIDGKAAAETFATVLGGLPAAPGAVGAVHDHGEIDVDFGRQCVINTEYTRIHRVASITGYSDGVRVGVHETVSGAPNARSFSIYHLIRAL